MLNSNTHLEEEDEETLGRLRVHVGGRRQADFLLLEERLGGLDGLVRVLVPVRHVPRVPLHLEEPPVGVASLQWNMEGKKSETTDKIVTEIKSRIRLREDVFVLSSEF